MLIPTPSEHVPVRRRFQLIGSSLAVNIYCTVSRAYYGPSHSIIPLGEHKPRLTTTFEHVGRWCDVVTKDWCDVRGIVCRPYRASFQPRWTCCGSSLMGPSAITRRGRREGWNDAVATSDQSRPVWEGCMCLYSNRKETDPPCPRYLHPAGRSAGLFSQWSQDADYLLRQEERLQQSRKSNSIIQNTAGATEEPT